MNLHSFPSLFNFTKNIKPHKILMGGEEEQEEQEEEDDTLTKWVGPLLQSRFFRPCKVHAAAHKSECNMFCLDCIDGPLCPLCLTSHQRHRSIQIRRSSYHDVIRASEIQKHMDIAGVQTYVINSAKIVFLNQRPQPPRPARRVNNSCRVCRRSLLDSFRYCSLACKISAGTSNKCWPKEKITRMDITIGSDSDDMMHNNSNEDVNVTRSKIHSFTPSTPPRTSLTKRRKGVPRRAPTGGLLIEC